MNMQMRFLSSHFLLDTRGLPLHWKACCQCECAGGFTFSHHTSVSCILDPDWLPNEMWCHKILQVHTFNWDSRWTQRNFPPSADECENRFLVANSETQTTKWSNNRQNTRERTLTCPRNVWHNGKYPVFSISKSWNKTSGRKWPVWLVYLVCFQCKSTCFKMFFSRTVQQSVSSCLFRDAVHIFRNFLRNCC